jgi:hypothetical protein
MKKTSFCVVLFVMFLILLGPGFAAEKSVSDLPWKKGYLNLGYFLADLDSGFRIGDDNIGVGVDMDVEKFLGLDTTDRAFRIDAGYRFGKTEKHKMEFSWFKFDREGQKFLGEVVDIPPELGGGTIGPGDVRATFNFDIIKLKYEYSLILDDRVDLNVGAGLFIMPVEFGLVGIIGGVGTSRLEESITAPLPVFGLGVDFAFTPKWILRQQLDLFYIEIGNFQGSITSVNLALEYLPWKNVGFGLGVDGLDVEIEATKSDYPGVGDFNGNLAFSYIGVQLYLKLFY